MTNEKRAEMTKYREKAIKIEHKLKKKEAAKEVDLLQMRTLQKQVLNFHCSEVDSESTVDNDYLKVSNLNHQSTEKKDRTMLKQLDLSAADLQKLSDTFIYNTLESKLKSSFTDEDDVEIKRSTSSSSITSMISNVTSVLNSKNTVSIPTIEIDPPTPIGMNKNLIENSDSKKNNKLGNPLIRSNSFTLESPSTALLHHHKKTAQKKKSTATNDTIESTAKKVTPLKVLALQGNKSSLHSNKRSPYESRSTKMNRKKTVLLSKTRFPSKGLISIDALRNIEEGHREKLVDLFKKQKEEQKELQTKFESQQQLLINELTKEMTEQRFDAKSPNSKFEASPPYRKSYSDYSEFEKKTPRRKLFASSSPDNQRRVSFQ